MKCIVTCEAQGKPLQLAIIQCAQAWEDIACKTINEGALIGFRRMEDQAIEAQLDMLLRVLDVILDAI